MLALGKTYFETELYIPGACRLVEDRVSYLLNNLDNRYIRSSDQNGEISLNVNPIPLPVARYGSEIALSVHPSFENYMMQSGDQFFPELFSTDLKSSAYFIKNPNNIYSISELKYQPWHRLRIGEHNMILKLVGSSSLWVAIPQDPRVSDNYQIARKVNGSCELEEKLGRFFEL